jgi:hypothetical protein
MAATFVTLHGWWWAVAVAAGIGLIFVVLIAALVAAVQEQAGYGPFVERRKLRGRAPS